MVGAAANGLEAVTIARLRRPDFIIIDYAMPVMNGEEAAVAIRELLPDARRSLRCSMRSQTGLMPTSTSTRRASPKSHPSCEISATASAAGTASARPPRGAQLRKGTPIEAACALVRLTHLV